MSDRRDRRVSAVQASRKAVWKECNFIAADGT